MQFVQLPLLHSAEQSRAEQSKVGLRSLGKFHVSAPGEICRDIGHRLANWNIVIFTLQRYAELLGNAWPIGILYLYYDERRDIR